MQAFTADAKILSTAFSLALSATENKTIPILGFVKVESGDGKVQLSATNMECSIVTEIVAACDEPFVVCVLAQQTADLLKLIKGNVTFKLLNGALTITGEKLRHRIPTLLTDQFPAIDQAQDRRAEISGELLSSMLAAVAIAAETNPNGEDRWKALELVAKGGKLSITACCGPRLANAETPLDGEFSVLLPERNVAMLARFVAQSEKVSLATNDNLLTVYSANGAISLQLSAQKWPDWRPLIQPSYAHTIEFDSEAMSTAIKRALLSCENRAFKGVTVQKVNFEFKADEAILTAAGQNKGESREQVALACPSLNGHSLQFGLAGNQLMDYFKTAGSGVTVCEQSDGCPLRFTPKEPLPFTFQYIQLPLRS